MKKLLIALLLLFLPLSTQALSTFVVPQGGTGVGTLTGWLLGNGTSPFTASTSPFFNAFSFNLATGTSATTTSFFSTTASSTNLSVGGSLRLFGTLGTALSDFCVAITGGSGLCDGVDSSGSGGAGLATSTPIADKQVIYGTSAADVGAEAAFTYDYTSNLLTADHFYSTGSSTLNNFTFVNATGTYATTTSLFATTASTTNLFGQFFNGFGLATCTGTNALTWSGGSFSCTAQPQGTVTAVTGTWPIISSGGATPNLTWGGLSTSTNPTVGQVPYWTAANTFGSVATSSLVQSTGVNIANGTTAYVLGAQPTFTVDQNFSPTWTGAHVFNNITRSTTTQATTTNLSVGTLFRSGTTDGCGTWAGGILSSTGVACGSGGGGTNTDKFASSTDGLTIYPNGITTNVGIGAVPLRATNALLNLFATSTTGNLINASSTTNFSGNFLNFNNAAGTSLFKVDSVGTVVIGDGTVSSPALAFADDTNNGLYSPANDIFGIVTNGVERMRFDDGTGFAGMSTATPQWLLTLATSTRSQLTLASGIGTEIPWSFRSVGSNLYIATSSPSTYATSTVSAFSINANGLPTFPSLTTGVIHSTAGLFSSGQVAISTEVSGLGANVATFLGTPTSANFASAVTGETGTGAVVFDTTPTFTTNITAPLVIGGTGVGSTLTIQSTSGVGTSDAILFKVGNNGGTEAARFTTSGRLALGTTTPTWDFSISSSTGAVMELNDTNAGTNKKHIIFGNYDGLFAIGTSSDSNLTSTSTAFSLDPSQAFSALFGTSTPTTGVGIDAYNIASSTLRLDSSSATKGGCIVMKDTDGSGYTYVTANNGVLTASQTSCL